METRGLLWKSKFELPSAEKWVEAATKFWIENNSGDSVYIVKIGAGWAVQIQEAFLVKKSLNFVFKGDIPSFEYSYHDISGLDWNHLYATKEEALEFYLKYKKK